MPRGTATGEKIEGMSSGKADRSTEGVGGTGQGVVQLRTVQHKFLRLSNMQGL